VTGSRSAEEDFRLKAGVMPAGSECVRTKAWDHTAYRQVRLRIIGSAARGAVRHV